MSDFAAAMIGPGIVVSLLAIGLVMHALGWHDHE